jgi:dolichol kinase
MYILYVLAFLAASLLSSFAYAAWLMKSKRVSDLMPLVASVTTALIVYLLLQQYQLGAHYAVLAIELGIALSSSMLVQLYMSKPKTFIVLTLIMLAGFVLYSYGGFAGFPTMGVFGISTMYGLVYRNLSTRHKARSARKEKSKEIVRDVIQIIMGGIIIAMLAFFKPNASVPMVFTLIILGYAVNDLSGEKSLGGAYKAVESRLERSGVVYGSGALYIAAGTALVIGFVVNPLFVMFGMIVLFFSDSAATIVGISIDFVKLPYNKDKSLMGSLAFLIVAASLGYLVIGVNALILAVPLAFIESLNTHLDDNVSVAIAIVIASVLLRL